MRNQQIFENFFQMQPSAKTLFCAVKRLPGILSLKYSGATVVSVRKLYFEKDIPDSVLSKRRLKLLVLNHDN